MHQKMTLWFHSLFSVFQNLRIICRQSLTLLWAPCFHRRRRPDQYHPAHSGTVEGCGRSHKGGGICCLFNRNFMSKELFLKVFIQISPFLSILFKLNIFPCLLSLPHHTYTPSMPLFFLLSTYGFHPYFIIFFSCLLPISIPCKM